MKKLFISPFRSLRHYRWQYGQLLSCLKRGFILSCFIIWGCLSVSGKTILPFGWFTNQAWECKALYTANDAMGIPDNWYSPDFDDSEWPTVEGPMSSARGAVPYKATMWSANYTGYRVRRHFTLDDIDKRKIYTFYVAHDDYFVAYLNGVEFYRETSHWDVGNYHKFQLTDEMTNLLRMGDNVLAIYVYDAHGGEKFLDCGLYDDEAELSLSTDKTIYEEGETIHVMVSVDNEVSNDVSVRLTIEQMKRFRMPSQVIIRAGEKSTSVDIPIIDDNIPANNIDVELTASATDYASATRLFMLNDNDVPAIQMSLTPSIVSEGAGANAIYATIARSDVTNSSITIRLSDDSGGELYYNSSVAMKEGETEKTVEIGVKDNAIVDGEREVKLTAAIYISTCDCNVVGEKQTSVTKAIHIIDNDGPTLALVADRTSVLEGDEKGATFTVTRNDAADHPLVVEIIHDASDVNVPSSVTIPTGERSVTFTLTASANENQEGNRIVNIMAKAEGYSSGSTWLMLTDQTLPDMTISDVTLDADSVLIGETYTVTFTVKNLGAAEIPARSTVTLNAADDEITLTLSKAIPAGGMQTESAVFKAPLIPGTYPVNVSCNNSVAFAELQTINNSNRRLLEVMSPYTLTISTDAKIYSPGGLVKLTGTAKDTKGNVAGMKVEPYVLYLGTRTALEATTDESGTFMLDYILPEGIGGNYVFGVCLPGEGGESTMTSVDVYGMARPSASYVKNYLYVNEPYIASVPIKNLSSLPLHNVKATIIDENGHYIVDTKEISFLEGNATRELEMLILSNKASDTEDWERMRVNVTSDEGATLSFMVYNYCYSQEAQLTLCTSNIHTTVTKGENRLYPIILTNTGLAETGKITVDIPSSQRFVSLANTVDIPSLATGDSIVIWLKFNPYNLDVNVIQKGSIAINCENASGKVIGYSVKVVSEAKGSLQVKVQDENTIYGNAAGKHPYVSGASVTIKDYNTGAILQSTTTGQDGTVLFDDVNEGYYTVYVTAPKHDTYIQNVLVNPGEMTEHVATISYDAIGIHFDVQEVSIDDTYEITAELTYETQVPVPIVVMDAPDELDLNKVIDGGTLLYNIVVRNTGLITAQDVHISLPQAEGVDFIPLAEYAGFDLAPEQSRIIPVYVCPSDASTEAKALDNGLRRKADKVTYKCSSETYLDWKWVCGPDSKFAWLNKPVKWLLRTCTPSGTPDTPTKGKEDIKKPIPDPPTGPSTEIVLRYPNKPISQIDLYQVYQWTCKIACALTCLAPDPAGKLPPCLPVDLYEMRFAWPEPDCLDEETPLECIKKSLTDNYSKRRTDRRLSPYDTLIERYMAKMTILTNLAYSSFCRVFLIGS